MGCCHSSSRAVVKPRKTRRKWNAKTNDWDYQYANDDGDFSHCDDHHTWESCNDPSPPVVYESSGGHDGGGGWFGGDGGGYDGGGGGYGGVNFSARVLGPEKNVLNFNPGARFSFRKLPGTIWEHFWG